MNRQLRSRVSTSLPVGIFALPICANRQCLRPPTVWQRWWARNEGIRFESEWFCSVDCFAAGLLPRLTTLSAEERLHRPTANRLPLGLILLSRGSITSEQLRQALKLQREAAAGRIGEWLVRTGAATSRDVVNALAEQQGCPVFAPAGAQRFPEHFTLPLPLIRHYGGVPVFFSSAANSAYLGFAGRLSHSLLRAAEHVTGCRVKPCIISDAKYRTMVERWSGSISAQTVAVEQGLSPLEIGRSVASYAQQTAAETCALSRCEQHVWVRLASRTALIDLLFRVTAKSSEEDITSAHSWLD